jgi:pimeloyl-ACP methyl ester carboxylesterase
VTGELHRVRTELAMSNRKIQINRFMADQPLGKPPLLFVHGAYVDSSCWAINFIPYFNRHGFNCYSIDLAGHGKSDGHQNIDDFGIADYVDDLSFALAQIDQEPILIGHSMGARVVERFIEKHAAPAAIFLAPVPTTGTAGSAVQLSLRYPGFFETIDQVSHGKPTAAAAELMTKIYFSPTVTTEEALRFFPMVGPESQLAVAEMALPDMRFRVQRQRLPVLVVGGSADVVFPASLLHFVASPWCASVFRATGAGHMLMLDHEWEAAANHMLGWITQHFPE